jgi:hypothetical protein
MGVQFKESCNEDGCLGRGCGKSESIKDSASKFGCSNSTELSVVIALVGVQLQLWFLQLKDAHKSQPQNNWLQLLFVPCRWHF